MDRPFVRVRSTAKLARIAVLFAGLSQAFAAGASGADQLGIGFNKLPAAGPIALPSSPPSGNKPLSVDQIRTKYEIDRKRDQMEILLKQKKYDEAIALGEQMVAGYQAAGLLDDDKNLEWHIIFGQINTFDGNFKAAEVSFRKGIRFADEAFGPTSRNAGKARFFLGKLQKESLDDRERAFVSVSEAVAILRGLGNPHDEDLLIAIHFIGRIEASRGRVQESLAAVLETCDMRRERNERPTLEQAVALRDLGELYVLVGDLASARAGFDEAAEIFETVQGVDGAEVKSTRELSLKCALAATRRLPPDVAKEAAELVVQYNRLQHRTDVSVVIPVLSRLIEIYRAHYGERDAVTLETMQCLGLVYVSENDYAAGNKLLREAAKILDAWSEAPPRLRGTSEYGVGLAAYRLKQYVDAAVHFNRALKYYTETEKNLTTQLQLLHYLSSVESAVGDFATALGHSETAAALAPESDKESFRDTMESCAIAAACAGEERELRSRAHSLLNRICERTEAVLGEKDILTAYVLDCRATFECRNADPSAIRTQERALTIYRSLPPDDEEFDLLKMEFDLAHYRCVFGDLDGARELLEKLLPELTSDKRRVLKGTVLRSLAMIDACQARRESAIARWQDAIALLELEELKHARAAAMFRDELDDYLSGKLPGLTTADMPVGFRRANTLTFYEDEL